MSNTVRIVLIIVIAAALAFAAFSIVTCNSSKTATTEQAECYGDDLPATSN